VFVLHAPGVASFSSECGEISPGQTKSYLY
jgi:hypothetical protein